LKIPTNKHILKSNQSTNPSPRLDLSNSNVTTAVPSPNPPH